MLVPFVKEQLVPGKSPVVAQACKHSPDVLALFSGNGDAQEEARILSGFHRFFPLFLFRLGDRQGVPEGFFIVFGAPLHDAAGPLDDAVVVQQAQGGVKVALHDLVLLIGGKLGSLSAALVQLEQHIQPQIGAVLSVAYHDDLVLRLQVHGAVDLVDLPAHPRELVPRGSKVALVIEIDGEDVLGNIGLRRQNDVIRVKIDADAAEVGGCPMEARADAFDHEPVDDAVGQEAVAELEPGVVRVFVRARTEVLRGLGGTERGNKVVPVVDLGAQAELLHDVEHIALLVFIIGDRVLRGPLFHVFRGFFQFCKYLRYLAVGYHAVFAVVILFADHDDRVDRVRQPFGVQHLIAFQLLPVLLVVAEADAQVVEPFEQPALDVFVGDPLLRAEGFVFFLVDVVFAARSVPAVAHVVQRAAHAVPGAGELHFGAVEQERLFEDFLCERLEIVVFVLPGAVEDGIADNPFELVSKLLGVDARASRDALLAVDREDDGAARREAVDVFQPVARLQGQVVVAALGALAQHHHIEAPAGQEAAVHGVHDLLPAEIPEVDLHPAIGLPKLDVDAGGLICVDPLVRSVFQNALYGVALSRAAVAQEDHLALADRDLRLVIVRLDKRAVQREQTDRLGLEYRIFYDNAFSGS